MSKLNDRTPATPESPLPGTPPTAVDALSTPPSPRVRRTPIRSAWERVRRLMGRGTAN